MGLLNFLRRLFGLRTSVRHQRRKRRRRRKRLRKIKLVPLRYEQHRASQKTHKKNEVENLPYRFASLNYGFAPGSSKRYLDFSDDYDRTQLNELQLPFFCTPDELALWLDIPVGQLAWLVHRFSDARRPESVQKAHYHYRWIKKRTGGRRLIEAPKRLLKSVQNQILRKILNLIPAHDTAHGFVAGRSIVTNARPHTGQRVLLKFDLENFYASVSYSRVVAIFRRVGYSREAALWLARLTTSTLPANIPFPDGDAYAIRPYLPRHLPQGAPSSPALANLSAFALDVRLSGMARCFDAVYTRYADDLTFSGSQHFLRAMPLFIPLVTKIIRSERFRVNLRKRKVIRNNQRQTVTGVVVNERPNISRKDFDRLKAILTNCVHHGPSSQNRDRHENFAAHLRGRVAYVSQLNKNRGSKLFALYQRIDWQR
ncbi:MAG: RNA-directed DNA polymerase [Planctomycetes bacterium]|nr:RNA-directed DNA polymerase [Planctomycetota bacterium]